MFRISRFYSFCIVGKLVNFVLCDQYFKFSRQQHKSNMLPHSGDFNNTLEYIKMTGRIIYKPKLIRIIYKPNA